MGQFIAGALGILVLLALGALLIFVTFSLLSKEPFKKQRDWFFKTSFWKRIYANREIIRLFLGLAGLAFATIVIAAFAMVIWEDHQDTIKTVGFVGLYGIWKIGKWVLIFGFAYFVIKTVVNGIIEAVSDRVAEKMRDRD